METSSIFSNVIRRWWIVLIIFLLTVGATIYFNLNQKPVFESKSTLIAKPNEQSTEGRDLMSMLSLLNRDSQIITTFGELVKSGTIRSQAARRMSLSPEDLDTLRVNSRTISGTNILQITVSGSDATLVQEYTTALGEETIFYANTLYPTYQLRVLDPASVPGNQSRSSRTMNLVLGSGLGLFFGIGAAVAATWMSGNRETDYSDYSAEMDFLTDTDIQSQLDTLKVQFMAMHKELSETRALLQTTESEARSISISLEEITNHFNGKDNN